jgi:hypothetical protein
MRGNTVNIRNKSSHEPSLYLVSEYASDKWAPDAEHWIHTARHEAGHAVALVCQYRKLGWNDAAFERILIRPGAKASYITRRGRQSDCLGCVERGSELLPPEIARCDDPRERRRKLRSCTPHEQRLLAVSLEVMIVSKLAGPFSEMRSWNDAADLHSQEYRWACEDNEAEICRAIDYVDDLRAITGCGTLRSFELQSYELVRREWDAIVALADELMAAYVLEYDNATAAIEPWLTVRPTKQHATNGTKRSDFDLSLR